MTSGSNGDKNPFDPDAIRQTYKAFFGSSAKQPITGAAVCRVIKRQRAKFIKGPISLPWIVAAVQLPGKAVAVALLLKYLAGLQQTEIVKLEPKSIREFGISRQTVYRGLQGLEDAGLIQVSRGAGRAPVVTILNFEPDAAKPQPTE